MARCLYYSQIQEFINTSPETLLGIFIKNYHGNALTTTNESWSNEIEIMQETLLPWKSENGHIILSMIFQDLVNA